MTLSKICSSSRYFLLILCLNKQGLKHPKMFSSVQSIKIVWNYEIVYKVCALSGVVRVFQT